MKKNRFISRFLALLLCVTTVCSVFVGTMTTAYADSADSTEQISKFAESVTKLSVDAIIEGATSTNPLTKALGTAGINMFNSLFDQMDIAAGKITPGDKVDRLKDDVIGSLDALSSTMDRYHSAEMMKLDDISRQISVETESLQIRNFAKAYDRLHTKCNRFIELVDSYSDEISDKYVDEPGMLIDESTYNAYSDILSISGDSVIYESYLNSVVNELSANSKSFYQIIADTSLDTIDLNFADYYINNLTASSSLKDLPSLNAIQSNLDGIQTEFVVYTAVCMQAAKMEYECKNYELNHDRRLNGEPIVVNTDALTTAQSKFDSYGGELDALKAAFEKTSAKLDDATAATTTVEYIHDGESTIYSYRFHAQPLAWLVARSVGSWMDLSTGDTVNVTFDLNKDWIADAKYGLALSKVYYPHFSCGCLNCTLTDDIQSIKLLNGQYADDINLTINLNGHTIDTTPCADSGLLNGYATLNLQVAHNVTINGDPDRQSAIIGCQDNLIKVSPALGTRIGRDVRISGVTLCSTSSYPSVGSDGKPSSSLYMISMNTNSAADTGRFYMDNCTVERGDCFIFENPRYSVKYTEYHLSNCTMNVHTASKAEDLFYTDRYVSLPAITADDLIFS